ncbi:hypothetical protein RIF29_27095 [Crotalaria pallida]|uniref:Transmembrane protein n=1 Tax=Crotalaria pallida TaxID=3830 RepID=A0AAN9I061_CROPI
MPLSHSGRFANLSNCYCPLPPSIVAFVAFLIHIFFFTIVKVLRSVDSLGNESQRCIEELSLADAGTDWVSKVVVHKKVNMLGFAAATSLSLKLDTFGILIVYLAMPNGWSSLPSILMRFRI